jgi:hypothetical protein
MNLDSRSRRPTFLTESAQDLREVLSQVPERRVQVFALRGDAAEQGQKVLRSEPAGPPERVRAEIHFDEKPERLAKGTRFYDSAKLLHSASDSNGSAGMDWRIGQNQRAATADLFKVAGDNSLAGGADNRNQV